MARLTRRSALTAGGAALAAPALLRAQSLGSRIRVAVIGAGVFGAWIAEYLRRAGHQVTLIDAWGPAHARASSGGESRMTRAGYGQDEVYARMAVESLAEWQALSAEADLPLFHPTGVLFLFQDEQPFATATLETHGRLGLPTRRLGRQELRSRFGAAIALDDIEFGIFEPQFGVLMARRAVQKLVARFAAAGGRYLLARCSAPRASAGALRVVQSDQGAIEADQFVFAAGPWLGKLFPDLIGPRLFVTRQEVYFLQPPAGSRLFSPGRSDSVPGWADWNGGDLWYGMPDIEARGFKLAFDRHGAAMDPDTGDRTATPAGIEAARTYLARRFPLLARAPLNEARVCQYENSANGDLLIDRHPDHPNLLLVGTGSGHGFKHGPAVGRYAAELLTGTVARVEPRFSLASKSERQVRAVQ